MAEAKKMAASVTKRLWRRGEDPEGGINTTERDEAGKRRTRTDSHPLPFMVRHWCERRVKDDDDEAFENIPRIAMNYFFMTDKDIHARRQESLFW